MSRCDAGGGTAAAGNSSRPSSRTNVSETSASKDTYESPSNTASRRSSMSRAGKSNTNRKNWWGWTQLCAAVCLALHLPLCLADNKPGLTIVDLESLRNAALNATSAVAHKPVAPHRLVLFSPEWEEIYSSMKVGCHLGRKRYVWRPCGVGSNILHLMNAFVYGLAVKRWTDVAVITPAGQLDFVKCTAENGAALSGFDCLFKPMPHVCTFSSKEEWRKFMTTKTVRKSVQEESEKLNWQYIRLEQRGVQSKALEPYGIDTFGALAVVARYLWGNIEPALARRVRQEVRRPALDVFRESPYVGLHIRRGDKIAEGEMEFIETKEYLSRAKKYLEDDTSETRTSVDEIKSIWVASDDDDVVDQVKALATQYFPNVVPENVAWISGGGKDGTVQTRSELESYNGFVFIFADLQLLSTADVFVGTFTSNISRLVAVLREAIGEKPRDSCISLDKEKFDLNY